MKDLINEVLANIQDVRVRLMSESALRIMSLLIVNRLTDKFDNAQEIIDVINGDAK
jgi:hypothetical protein